MPPPHPPPALVDDSVQEILLRLPPDKPASLVHASLVCKQWRRLLSDPDFPRRYRAFHQAPPLLGFLHNQCHDVSDVSPRFVSFTTPSPFSSCPPVDAICYWAIDCRHGHVLIRISTPPSLVVWDPITGDQMHVPLPAKRCDVFTAAVLCAKDGCNHLKCNGGPFRLVFKGANWDDDGLIWASIYSSETGMWSVPVSIHIDPIMYPSVQRSLLVGDAVYFTHHEDEQRFIKYDMGRHVLSVGHMPYLCHGNMTLVAAEDGRLGIAGVEGYSLRLWWQLGPDGDDAEWVPSRVIELEMMHSISIGNPSRTIHVAGFAERSGIVFVSSNAGIFSVEIKSGQVRKVDQRTNLDIIFPYESFYNPVHADARLQEPTKTG